MQPTDVEETVLEEVDVFEETSAYDVMLLQIASY